MRLFYADLRRDLRNPVFLVRFIWVAWKIGGPRNVVRLLRAVRRGKA